MARVEVRANPMRFICGRVRVAGFYSMGVADYDDNSWSCTSISRRADGLDWGSATSIQIAVPDPMR